MEQQSFAEMEYTHKKRKPRRGKFLERTDGLIRGRSWRRA